MGPEMRHEKLDDFPRTNLLPGRGRDAKWHAEAKQHDFPLSILGLLLAQ